VSVDDVVVSASSGEYLIRHERPDDLGTVDASHGRGDTNGKVHWGMTTAHESEAVNTFSRALTG